MKNVRIPSFSDPYSVQIRENTDHKTSKYIHLSSSVYERKLSKLTLVTFKSNLKKFFLSGPRLYKVLHSRVAGKKKKNYVISSVP